MNAHNGARGTSARQVWMTPDILDHIAQQATIPTLVRISRVSKAGAWAASRYIWRDVYVNSKVYGRGRQLEQRLKQIDPITRGRVCTIQLDSRYRLKDIDDLEIIAHSFPGLRTISGDGYRIDLKPDRLFLSRFTEMCENLHINTEAYRGPHSWENLILKWQSFQIPTSIIIGSSDSAILFKCDLGNLTHTAMGDAITAMRKLDAAPQNRLRDGIPNPKLVAAVWRLDLSNLDTLGRLVRFVNEGSLCGIDRVPRIDLVHDDFNPATGENKFQGTVGIDRHPAARLLCDQLIELDQRTHNVSLSVRDPNLGLGEVALVLLTMLPFIRTRKSFGFSFILGRTAISNVSNRLSNGIANIDIDVSVKANTGKIDKPQMCIAMLPKQVIGGAAINTGRRMPKEMKAFGNVIAPLVDKDSDVEFRMHDRHFDGPEDDLEVWRRSFVRAVQAQRDVKVDDEGIPACLAASNDHTAQIASGNKGEN